MMALGTFIAGRYTCTYNSNALGIMSEGYELQLEPHEALINRSDAYGDMIIDTITRGSDWYLQYEAMEYTPTAVAAMFPYGTLGQPGTPGLLGSGLAKALVLTATSGTPAAAAPATLTANLAKLAPNSQPRINFNSMLRTVPTRLQFLPYDSSGIKHFTTT